MYSKFLFYAKDVGYSHIATIAIDAQSFLEEVKEDLGVPFRLLRLEVVKADLLVRPLISIDCERSSESIRTIVSKNAGSKVPLNVNC